RFAKMCFELAVAFIPVLVVFFIADIIDFNAFVNPKALYLTQDLWDKTGSDFWSAFLFETPFALMRGIIWLFILLMIIFYLYFVVYSFIDYFLFIFWLSISSIVFKK